LKIRWLLLIAAFSLNGCTTPNPGVKPSSNAELPNNAAFARTANRVLILSASYYDPTTDTVGINKLTEDVTQAFSIQLQPLLFAAGKTPINVNDKTRKYSAGETLALHASQSNADNVVLLGIDSPLSNGEYTIQLKVRYFDLRYVMRDGAPASVIPTNPFERSYLLKGPGADPNLSWEQVALRFTNDLKTSGRLK
jgi:hypothetical protein